MSSLPSLSSAIPNLRDTSHLPQAIKKKESRFRVSSTPAPLPIYSPLNDNGLWHHFSAEPTQKFLIKMGFLNKNTGELIDIDKFRTKWYVLQNELYLAQQIDERRRKETAFLIEQKRKLREVARFQREREREVQTFVKSVRQKREEKSRERAESEARAREIQRKAKRSLLEATGK